MTEAARAEALKLNYGEREKNLIFSKCVYIVNVDYLVTFGMLFSLCTTLLSEIGIRERNVMKS